MKTLFNAILVSSAFITNNVNAEVPLEEQICKGIVAIHLTKYFPVGEATIRNNPFEQGETQHDHQRRSFNQEYLRDLRLLQSKGLIALTEGQLPDNPLAAMVDRHYTTIHVTPTALGKEGNDQSQIAAEPTGKYVGGGYFAIPQFHCKVLKIISNVPYQAPQLSSSEKYILVLGTYRVTPTKYCIHPNDPGGDFKFKVVMKLNQFTNQY